MGIPTLIADNSSDTTAISSISFTSGINNLYDEYMFVFTDINPTGNVNFAVQFNASGESGYNETIMSSVFNAAHTEADATAFAVDSDRDQALGTSFQSLTENHSNAADSGGAGILYLFNPSSTTYVTNFYCRSSFMTQNNGAYDMFTSGFINTTAAITDVQFKFLDGGNFDGLVQMYGID